MISPLTSIPEHAGQTNMACARRANRACRRLTPRLPQPLFRPLRPNRPRPPPKLPPISFLTPWRIFFPPIGSAICAPRGCAGAARVRTTPTRHAAVRAVCAPLLCAAHQSVRNKCCFQSALSGARPFPVAAEMGAENLNQPAYTVHVCIACRTKNHGGPPALSTPLSRHVPGDMSPSHCTKKIDIDANIRVHF